MHELKEKVGWRRSLEMSSRRRFLQILRPSPQFIAPMGLVHEARLGTARSRHCMDATDMADDEAVDMDATDEYRPRVPTATSVATVM